jgi:myo-inositol-1(or 4)-monophosphatase
MVTKKKAKSKTGRTSTPKRAKAGKAKPKPKAKAKAKAKPKAKPKAKAAVKPKRGSASSKSKLKKGAKASVNIASPKKKPAAKKKAAAKAKSTAKAKSAAQAKPKKKSAAKAKPVSTAAAKVAAKAAAKAAAPAVKKKVKLLPRQFISELADHIHDAVAPSLLAAKGREIVGSAPSGDATFKIDVVAEKALLEFLTEAKKPVAYYSEDQGYTTFTSGQPQHLLVIDPIDGTRAAKSGFESCVVSIATTQVIERPRMADVNSALIRELKGDRTFYAERGKGTRVYIEGQPRKPRLSSNTDPELMSWAMTVPARPAELIFPTAAKLIDLTSLKGGFFACNSTSYSLTRLLTNQLDACVDFANRYMRDIPKAVEDHFINAGRGAVLGIAPYDIAASLLVAEEAGCVVTDAFGKSFEDVLLLDTSPSNFNSMIAAGNKKLHEWLMTFFDTRIRQYEQLLKRRAEALAERG